jgi:hypothetical protein
MKAFYYTQISQTFKSVCHLGLITLLYVDYEALSNYLLIKFSSAQHFELSLEVTN